MCRRDTSISPCSSLSRWRALTCCVIRKTRCKPQNCSLVTGCNPFSDFTAFYVSQIRLLIDGYGVQLLKISRVIKCRSIVTTFRKSLSVNLSLSAPASVDAALTDHQSFEKSRDIPGRRGFHPPPLLVTRLFWFFTSSFSHPLPCWYSFVGECLTL